MPVAQPGSRDGRLIGAAGGGGAFFGDDLGISGARQVRTDAPQILVHARYPLFAAEFAVLVGQGNHGGYFAAPEAERIAVDKPLRRAFGQAGNRRGQPGRNGITQIHGGDGVVGQSIQRGGNLGRGGLGQQGRHMIGRNGQHGGIKGFAVHQQAT